MKSLNISTRLLQRFAAFPVPLALGSCEEFTGRGVTLAVLDAAFTPHPELTQPENRILAYFDATGENEPLESGFSVGHWHGTMTSVVAAGNGALSDGLYRSLAPDARVVLIKVWGPRGIDEGTVVRGLRWLLDHRELHNIRILTASVRATEAMVSAWDSEADVLLESLVSLGVTVVCAAGNDYRVPTPPANSPSVITVGGVSLAGRHLLPYDSSCYGDTLDGFRKPEIVALASQVAAPILPGSDTAAEAAMLTALANSDCDEVVGLARAAGVLEHLNSPDEILDWVAEQVRERGYLSAHYKSVDGTSFAAPIVASVVAQMLEANPDLHPRQIKQILMQTADRVDGLEVERQGFGLVNPRRAVERALAQPHERPQTHWFHPPRREGEGIVFRHFRPLAERVSLAADFSDWQPLDMTRSPAGLWQLTVPLGPGSYAYKLIVDGEWQQDPNNLQLAADGLGGYNSTFRVGSEID